MKNRTIHFALFFMAIHASWAAHADDVMSNAQAIEFLAVMTASGEVCAARYPELRKGVEQWGKSFDGPTRKGVTRILRTPEFAEALAKARTDKQVLEVTEVQCKLNFK